MIQQNEKIKLTNWEIVSVNPADKNWDWKDFFCFWAVNIQSIIGFSLIASLYIIYDLNFFIVLSGSLFASLLVYFFSNLIGNLSQKHGIPFVVFLRTSIGLSAAKYFGMLRGLIGIFFFGVQTFFISKSIVYLIRITLFNIDPNLLNKEIFLSFFMALNLIDWFALIFTFWFQYLLFSKDQHLIKKIIKFSGIFVYFGLILFFIMIVSEYGTVLINRFNQLIDTNIIFQKNTFLQFISVAGTMFAFFSIVILNFGDFSRYAKNQKELKRGNLTLIFNLIVFSLLSVLITLGADTILNKNLTEAGKLLTNPTDIIGKFNNTYLTIVALFFILVASMSTNLIANYIPSQNTLLNFLPDKLTLKSSGFIIFFISLFIAIFWLPLLSQIGILSFVDTIGAFFGPIFGLMICDYYSVKKRIIVNKDIFSSKPESSYMYSNGWHIKAVYSVLIGFIFSASTIWNIDLRFLQSYSWIIGAFVTYISYYLLASR
ncbi:MAG: cytosine permease [Candidatus Pelagibacter sp.]